MFVGSAASFMNEVPAWKSELTMMPASTRPSTRSPFACLLTQKTSTTVKRLMPKAARVMYALESPT